MCLRFVFLLITRLAAWLRLSRREEAWKTAEIFDPAPPARGPAAAAAAPPEAELGGPGPARGPARRDTERPPPRIAAAGHPGHDPALAPRHPPAPPGGAVDARQVRQAGHPPEHQGPGPPAGPGEPRMGLPQDPRGAGRPGSASLGVDRMGDPQERRNRPRAAPIRACPVAVPALPGRGDPGVRLLHGGIARRHPGLRAGRDRARDPAHPHPRRHPAPDREWTTQQARNLLMDLGGQADRMKFMIRDRGSGFTAAFDAVLADAGIRTVLCNVRTPRMNAIAERWIGGCRRELLDRTLVWNQHHLRRILRQYEIHHNQHRPHRSLHGAAPLKPLPDPVDLEQYRVRRHTRVGGLINEYRLVA